MASIVESVPLLKWPGGKRLLAKSIAEHLPREYGTYFEPFAGSASLFFFLRPGRATLSDLNGELIDVYRAVRDNVESVIAGLSRLAIGKDEYYRIRSQRPRSLAGKAIRFLYLNRGAFNGLYRVNRKGEFNVPFGCKPGTLLPNSETLRSISNVLRRATLESFDFEVAFSAARAGDLIYADPPYTTTHDNNGFRRYNESIFSWSDQERLAEAARGAASRGVNVVVSNAHHRDVEKLYPDFTPVILSRASCIAASASARKTVSELLLVARSTVSEAQPWQ